MHETKLAEEPFLIISTDLKIAIWRLVGPNTNFVIRENVWSAGTDRTGPEGLYLADPVDLELEFAPSIRSRATCQNVSAPRARNKDGRAVRPAEGG